jgi:hypothetical protein
MRSGIAPGERRRKLQPHCGAADIIRHLLAAAVVAEGESGIENLAVRACGATPPAKPGAERMALPAKGEGGGAASSVTRLLYSFDSDPSLAAVR